MLTCIFNEYLLIVVFRLDFSSKGHKICLLICILHPNKNEICIYFLGLQSFVIAVWAKMLNVNVKKLIGLSLKKNN